MTLHKLTSCPRLFTLTLMLLLPLVCSTTACSVLATEGKGVAGSPRASDGSLAVSTSWRSGAEGFSAARREQRAGGAPLAVYFYTDWCPYCKRFDEEFLTDGEVRGALTRVVKVRVNPEDGPEEEAVAKRFGVRGYPAFFIARPGAVPRQIYPFKPAGEKWVATSPGEFARACQAAASER